MLSSPTAADIKAVNALIVDAGHGSLDKVRSAIAAGVSVNALYVPIGWSASLDFWGGATALHAAGRRKHAHVVAELLRCGADPNAKRPSNGRIPLHSAVEGGDAEVIRLLLDAGSNVNERTLAGETPMDVLLRLQVRDCYHHGHVCGCVSADGVCVGRCPAC